MRLKYEPASEPLHIANPNPKTLHQGGGGFALDIPLYFNKSQVR